MNMAMSMDAGRMGLLELGASVTPVDHLKARGLLPPLCGPSMHMQH